MDKNEQAKPGLGAFYVSALVSGALLLAMIGWAVEIGPTNQGWWTQPRLMPAIGLVLWIGPALYLVYDYYQKSESSKPTAEATQAELKQWTKPFEYFVYYGVYIFLLSAVGYFLSTVTFILGLSWRVGLRSKRWRIIGILTALGLVAVFRWGLQIWIDPAWLYDLFPRGVRIFLARNF